MTLDQWSERLHMMSRSSIVELTPAEAGELRLLLEQQRAEIQRLRRLVLRAPDNGGRCLTCRGQLYLTTTGYAGHAQNCPLSTARDMGAR